MLGTLSDLGFSRNKCQARSPVQEAIWEVSPGNTYREEMGRRERKVCCHPWWLLHLTLELRAVVQPERVRCHINLSQLVNWSVTSQAREGPSPRSICHKQLLSPNGTTVADLVPSQTHCSYTSWGPIRNPQLALSPTQRKHKGSGEMVPLAMHTGSELSL